MKYKYLVSGITIQSDIYYSELVETDNEYEVTLSYGKVPKHLIKNNVDFPFIEANENQYLLRLENIGRLLIENGTTITIEKDANGNSHDIEKYVMTNILGALSYQRDWIPMHGGVFVHNRKGILITGASGNGKSTILTALMSKGYKILSDDISNLKIIDNKIFAFPCFPYLLIWDKTAKKFNLETIDKKRIRKDMEKYIYPMDKNIFHDTPIELSKIYFLLNEEIKEDVISIQGRNKIETLKKNTYKPWMIDIFKKQKNTFIQLSHIANNISLEIIYNNHKLGFTKSFQQFIDKLEKDA